MTKENLEELRDRLLCQQSVQEMIQIRAYEIFQMRGGQAGGEAQDWFHAEGEVLTFLIARESARENETSEPEPPESTPGLGVEPAATAPKKARPRTSSKSASAKTKAPKNTSSKSSPAKKSAASKSKPKRTSGGSKIEENSQT